MFPSYLPARCRCGEAGRHVFAAGRIERPGPRPRPGGRLDMLVRYARDLRRAGFDVVEDPTVFSAVLHALYTDIGLRRGQPALWRHAPRVLIAVERAFRADAEARP